jgi:hypothetical protein
VDETRAHARSRTGFTPLTRRVLDHREAWARAHAFPRVRGASRAWARACSRDQRPGRSQLQREESNLREDRLTGGCLTIRLRWNETARPRACSTSAPRTRTSLSGARFSESMGRTQVSLRVAWFRAQESNLRFWIQRPASCQLDDPGVTRAACEGHTSPGRSGGSRTLTTSIKSRVRLPIALRTRADARWGRASGG